MKVQEENPRISHPSCVSSSRPFHPSADPSHFQKLLVDVQAHPGPGTAEGLVVSGAEELALGVRHVLARGGAGVSGEVEGVRTPALAAVFDACVVEVRAALGTSLGRHDGAVVPDLLGEETALGRLLNAAVVGEVAVALPDNGASGGGSRGGCGSLGRC